MFSYILEHYRLSNKFINHDWKFLSAIQGWMEQSFCNIAWWVRMEEHRKERKNTAFISFLQFQVMRRIRPGMTEFELERYHYEK